MEKKDDKPELKKKVIKKEVEEKKETVKKVEKKEEIKQVMYNNYKVFQSLHFIHVRMTKM